MKNRQTFGHSKTKSMTKIENTISTYLCFRLLAKYHLNFHKNNNPIHVYLLWNKDGRHSNTKTQFSVRDVEIKFVVVAESDPKHIFAQNFFKYWS